MKYAAILFGVCLAIYACNNNNPPENLLNEDTYVSVLIELQLLQSYQTEEEVDSTTADSLQKAIFKKYETNQEQFQISHQYYQQDIEKQRDRLGNAVEELRKDHIAGQDSLTHKNAAEAN